jgi:hypothetical protein
MENTLRPQKLKNSIPTVRELKKIFVKNSVLKIGVFMIGELLFLLLVSMVAYQQGKQHGVEITQRTVSPSESPVAASPALAGPVYPTLLPSPTATSEGANPKINLGNIEELKIGYPSSAQNPEFEVFLFADITEDNFSGSMLTRNIGYLLDKYPQKVRVWYLHTVLAYRDTPSLRPPIGVLKCLADQTAVWPNMASLVKEKGSPDFGYQVSDQEKYTGCITEINKNKSFFDQQVKAGQLLMTKYGVTGVPTALFVSTKDPSQGIEIVGAVPLDAFKDQVQKIMGE